MDPMEFANAMSIRMQMDDIEKQIKRLSKAMPKRPVEKIIPEEELYGYRWTTDGGKNLYIVKLKINEEYWHDPVVANLLDYVTSNCTVVSIKRFDTGEYVNSIDKPEAYYHSKSPCIVNSPIQDDTWFCLSEKDLFLSQGQAINRIVGKKIISI